MHILGTTGFAPGNGHFALFGLGRLFVMLMLFDICQNTCLFTKFVKTAECLFEGFVIAYFNAGQLLNTSFEPFYRCKHKKPHFIHRNDIQLFEIVNGYLRLAPTTLIMRIFIK